METSFHPGFQPATWALLLVIYSGIQTSQKSCHSPPTLHLERKLRLREGVGHDQEAELSGPGSSLDSCPAACPTKGQPCVFKTTESLKKLSFKALLLLCYVSLTRLLTLLFKMWSPDQQPWQYQGNTESQVPYQTYWIRIWFERDPQMICTLKFEEHWLKLSKSQYLHLLSGMIVTTPHEIAPKSNNKVSCKL